MPSVRGSCTTCTSCSQKSHVHYFTHSPHFLRCLSRCLLCTTASCISLSPSHSAPRAARACSFSCGCLGGEQSRSGRISMHPAEPLGRWVFWRCRPHRIFMWETQTYCELICSGGADTYRSTFTLFIFPSCYFLEPTIYFLEPTIYCLFTFLT